MRLHVHTYGDPDGAPVVCLHGLSGHGPRYRRLAERLPGRHVVAPDLRGHGESGAEPPWTRETHVADLLETLDALEVGPAAWVGYSFGGLIASAVAEAAPDRVRRLALLEPALQLRPAVCLEYAEGELEDISYASEAEAVAAMPAAGMTVQAPREMLEEEARLNMVRGADGR
ncbi:MAG TPA: alpha/beta fold hydrolase, partial [Solirubrobacteraceae bacterium]|nr:alpha/beta fold hydrolase [Solirubrobacteraceae bacterium]